MIVESLTLQERDNLIAIRRRALDEYSALMDTAEKSLPWSEAEQTALSDAERRLAAAEAAEREYFHRLPRPAISCCPFDGKPLLRTFDPYGFDGPWWRSDASPSEIPACPHFCLMHGGVGRNGATLPAGVEESAGPDRPYVHPHILGKPGVVAVLSRFSMVTGNIAYLIAYFAERRPPVQELDASWPRSIFLYTTAIGEHRWRFKSNTRDFDLAPWLASGKVRWCDPDSNNERLSTDQPDACPYQNPPDKRPAD